MAIPSIMRVVAFAEYGGHEVLRCCQMRRPRPASGEILMQVEAIGVNPADPKFRAGALANHRPKKMPVVPGMDVAGTVVELGKGVSSFAVGDAIFGMLPPARLGGYAEFVTASAGFFAKRPRKLSVEAAAAIPTPGLTGVELIEDDLLAETGQRILVVGALGAVGRAAVFAAVRRGCHATAAVRSGRIAEVDFADAVLDIDCHSTERFDAIADTVGGETAAGFVDNLMPGGVMTSVATMRIPPTSRKDVLVRHFVCYPDSQRLADLAQAFIDGFPILPSIEVSPFDQVSEVHRKIEAGSKHKFVILT